MSDFGTQENYKFRAELKWPEGARLDVACKLFLPSRVRDTLQLVLLVDDERFNSLGRAKPFQLTAELGDGVGSVRIVANEVRTGKGSQKRWGKGLDEGYLLGHPRDLRLVKRFPEIPSNKLRGVFRLTESRQLAPRDVRTLYPDGTIEWRRGSRRTVEICPGITITFDHEYQYDTRDREIRMWPELVGRLEADTPPASTSLEDYLPQVDDLLLLLSLAEGQRCACLQAVSACCGEVATLYRLDRVVPPENPHHSVNDFLIDMDDLALFLDISYAELRKSTQRDLVWSALADATDFESSTVADEFIRLFTSFETLVLAFRRQNNLEYVLDDPLQREEVADFVKRQIKAHPLLAKDPVKRAMMYDNMPALERITLRRATESLALRFGIDLDDLWPLFNSSDGVSLVQIRNMLVHGEYFSEPEWGAIAEAADCLRVLVQRFLLTMLGWDYRKSRARSYRSFGSSWKSARASLPAR